MKSHEAHRWVHKAEEEDWPQDLQVGYVNDADGFFRGNWSVKNQSTGKHYTTNEAMVTLEERNHRFVLE